MESPLWTDRHAPALADLPQDDARERLERGVDEPVDLLVYGPSGVGKTAAVRALAEAAHEDADADLVEVNVADFFDRTKREIRADPRFERFLQGEIPWVRQQSASTKADLSKRYKSDWSKADMAKHVMEELASYAPASGSYKTVLLDNAEAMREDFQQSLRRTVERYHRNVQFVIATRQPTALIEPLRSRCVAVPMRVPTPAETVEVLAAIADSEGVPAEDDGLEYVAGYADGDLRAAVLGAQATAAEAGEITMNDAYEVLGEIVDRDAATEMLEAAEAGEFGAARSTLDDLLVDEGLDGAEVLDDLLAAARSRYTGERLARTHVLAGEVDADLAGGTSDRLHLSHLLAELGAGATG
ncbi:MAG: AAA family ATPase [Halobacteriaceae archaeon]